jgi:ribosomal protein L37AE/L43A
MNWTPPKAPPQDVRRNLTENSAKEAYEIWAYRVGLQTPWEHLPQINRQAFIEILENVEQEPKCSECGEGLFCLNCDATAVFECEFCGGRLTCECEKPERQRFRFKPETK